MTTEYIVTVERSDERHGPFQPASQVYRDSRHTTWIEAERRATIIRTHTDTVSATVTEVPAV